MKSAASVMRDLNYSTTDHNSLPIVRLMGRLGAVSNAAVAVDCDVHREPPSVPLVLSRALVAGWGMHREERSCSSPVTLRACKLQRRNTRWGKTERWRSASRPAMRAYDGSRLVFPR